MCWRYHSLPLKQRHVHHLLFLDTKLTKATTDAPSSSKKEPLISLGEYRSWAWPDDARIQGIDCHGIDLVFKDYPGVNTRRVKGTLCSINLGAVSLSNKTCYLKIPWSQKDRRLAIEMIISLWNLASGSPAQLPNCPPNINVIGNPVTQISYRRDSPRSYDKTFCRLLKRPLVLRSVGVPLGLPVGS